MYGRLVGKLGKAPHLDDGLSVLRLSKYLALSPDVLPTPPDRLDLTEHMSDKVFPMYGNDRYGDCTIAAAAHMTQIWSSQVGAEVLPDPANVVAMYFKITGGEDAGANEQNVLNFWTQHPEFLDDWAPKAFVACDPNDRNHIKIAADLFGGVYIGLQLPIIAQVQFREGQPWDVYPGPAGQPGSFGGHAVPVVGYDSVGPTVVSWGKTQKMTWNAWAAWCDESWAILPDEWERKPGINWNELEKDLQAVRG